MKTKLILLLAFSIFSVQFSTLFAQQRQGPALPVHVPNVSLTDLQKNPTRIPYYGQKCLMIFYVDPDVGENSNKSFTDALESSGRAVSPNIQGYSILNLKDTAYPNSIVMSMANKKTAGKPAINLADDNRILSSTWHLGDCNNKFCLLFVDRSGNLVYFRTAVKGSNLTAQDIQDFYNLLPQYK